MTYNELLGKKEWWLKCNEILSRDHFRCRDCGCLGFHNGKNYININCMAEMDYILDEWRFKGKRFSDFINNPPKSAFSKIKGIKMEEEGCGHDLRIYRLNLFSCKCPFFHSSFRTPTKIFLLTTKEVDIIDADIIYIGDLVHRNDSLSVNGEAYLFSFESMMTDGIYVITEYKESFLYISVTYENKLLFFSFKPCNFGMPGLNIHHTYYMRGCKPWEYKNESLVTLCESCHKKRHETLSVPLYDKYKRLISNLIPCDRCGGSGYLPQYSHVEHGICFKCSGEGVVLNE